DQFVVCFTIGRALDGPNHDGLKHTDLPDGVDQLIQVLLNEHGPRLYGVWRDVLGVEVGQPGTRDGGKTLWFVNGGATVREEDVDRTLGRPDVRGDECADTAPESGPLCCH